MDTSPPAWISSLAGRFIVFDGPDDCGKTTQLRRFSRTVTAAGVDVCPLRDPGGTSIGEQIRHVLLSKDNTAMDVRCELLLYMASRAQLVAELIAPALKRGALVLADRFISSTLAYQGTAGGISRADILDAGRIAVGKSWPDLVVVFDLDPTTAAARRSGPPDRVELKGLTFQQTVRQGFVDQAKADSTGYLVIDASPDEDTVHQNLMQGLHDKIISASW